MGSLSKITAQIRLPLNIKVPSYLMDHQFQGNAVLPAVEAMEILAATTVAHLPSTPIHSIHNAVFNKFLVIEKGANEIEAFNDLEVLDDGTVVSRFITRTRSEKAKITRTKDHAVLHFKNFPKNPTSSIPQLHETPGYHVSTETIYSTLVPFGPSYHNLKGVNLFEKGALGTVHAPRRAGLPIPLGSPFPLDAAFHVACVWGQRYAGLVGFPVGFGLRRVLRKICAGKTCAVEVFPKAVYANRFLVDIWIRGMDGVLQEVVWDVEMKDVTGGRIKPPSWIVKV